MISSPWAVRRRRFTCCALISRFQKKKRGGEGRREKEGVRPGRRSETALVMTIEEGDDEKIVNWIVFILY